MQAAETRKLADSTLCAFHPFFPIINRPSTPHVAACTYLLYAERAFASMHSQLLLPAQALSVPSPLPDLPLPNGPFQPRLTCLSPAGPWTNTTQVRIPPLTPSPQSRANPNLTSQRE